MLCLSLAACKSAPKPTRPMEAYDTPPSMEQVSTIRIPVRINMQDMERSINEQLAGIIFEDKDPDDGDNLALRVEKKDYISLAVSGRDLQYRVPMSLWFRYKAGFAYLTGTAEIAIQFRTLFDIGADWQLHTQTVIENYEWLRKPRLQVGAIQIPIGFIGDMVVNNSRNTITTTIDRLAKEQVNLRAQVEEAWKRMFEPELLSPEYRAWLLINPETIAITPLQYTPQFIEATILISSRPRLHVGRTPQTRTPLPLPPRQFSDSPQKDFSIYLHAEVPYQEAERIAREQLNGETFSSGNRTVTVQDVELYGKGNTLIVHTRLSGSFNGSVYLEGQPYYNPLRNSIDIKDLRFTVDTQNFLHKTAAWLLKSNLKRALQDNMDFLLDYNLKELEAELQKQLRHYPIAPGIHLEGQLSQLQIHNAYMAPEGIRVQVGLRGQVEVFVSGLN